MPIGQTRPNSPNIQVEIDDLGHRFNESDWLFRHLRTMLFPSNIYALTGPSGSGKSTLLSLLAGWVEPAEGRIIHTGTERIGWVFQNPHGVARRTVLDHVALAFLGQGLLPAEADARALELLEKFGLTSVKEHQFRSLSGGEGQRLMLATAIAAQPDLFLIDEPTAQLDLHTRESVNHAIAELADPSRIVVVATHDEGTKEACTEVIDLRLFQDVSE